VDKLLAARLNEEKPTYEPNLFAKLAHTAHEYIDAGTKSLGYHIPDLDAANDLVQCYSAITKDDFEKIDRNASRNFRHPCTATEISTLATFVSQILFGGPTARKVEPREDGDEDAAKAMNELLRWNDNQQATYTQGFLFCWDAMTFNRGIMYDSWYQESKVEVEPVEEDDITAAMVPGIRVDGRPRVRVDGSPIMVYPKITRWRKKRVPGPGYNKIDLVSPYDFICDPMLPTHRFQEGRFAGHRVMIPWHELKRRSELDAADPLFALPAVVERLKTRQQGNNATTPLIGNNSITSTSRSFYERQRRGTPVGQTGITGGAVNKDDGGVVECWVLYIRAKPKTLGIYEDDEEDEIIEILHSGQKELLSVNVISNRHDQFSYSIGEGRPNAHMQFGQSWALIIKPIQDFIDELKWRHAENVARAGNVFLCNPTLCKMEQFLDPNKIGLVIEVTEQGSGISFDNILRQIPVTDTTARFYEEMEMWIQHAEKATGAHASIQGQTEDPSQTLGQFDQVQQMAIGRISTMARCISESAIVPQTKRMVENFKQYMPEKMVIRITGEQDEYDPDKKAPVAMTIAQADIDREFDLVPHDGSLPGQDQKKGEAVARLIEAFANPAFAPFFDPSIPGNFDIKWAMFEAAKISGLNMKKAIISREKAQQNLRETQMAQGIYAPPAPAGIDPAMGQPIAPEQPSNVLPMSAEPAPTMPPAPPATIPQN